LLFCIHQGVLTVPQVIQPNKVAATDIPSIVDVRSRDEYLQEHIPGSQNIPLEELLSNTERLKQQEKLIISCRSGNRAAQACEHLQNMGLQNLQLLEGGLGGWKKANLPTVSLKKGFTIMQQVQIIVGVLVLTGVFYEPLWFLAPIAGVGMLFAGLTNTCMMAVLLSKMPWNKTPDSQSQCRLS
jgi:rhodanese-related sulfurtransferase